MSQSTSSVRRTDLQRTANAFQSFAAYTAGNTSNSMSSSSPSPSGSMPLEPSPSPPQSSSSLHVQASHAALLASTSATSLVDMDQVTQRGQERTGDESMSDSLFKEKAFENKQLQWKVLPLDCISFCAAPCTLISST